MKGMISAGVLTASVFATLVSAQSGPPAGLTARGGLPGYQAPPPIPGYDANTDPRDFSGVWRNAVLPGQTRFQLAPDIKLNAAGKLAAERTEAKMKAANATSLATPHVMCRPTGINQALIPIAPVYVLQNDKKIAFIVTDEIRNVRQVHLNQPHPRDLEPSYGGHSVAHWEGSTLVVDTIGYNGRGQLIVGSVHSNRLHLIERITKSADGRTLDIDATFEDPEMMEGPVRVRKQWAWVNGQQPLEFDCEENPREDNFADMLFEQEYLRPACIQHEGVGDEPSRVVCESAATRRSGGSTNGSR